MSGQLLEDRTGIKARTPMPTHDVTSATKILDLTAEAITYADGVAGTTQQIKLTYDGVLSAQKDRIGVKGDSSFSFVTGTALTTEVPWRYKNVNTKSHGDNDTDRLTSMANGEFMVDYENGYILGKNAITTSSATDTVNYSVRTIATAAISGAGDASAAKQDEQTAILTTIDTDTGAISTNTSETTTALESLLVKTDDNAGAEVVDPTSLSSYGVGTRQSEIIDESRRKVTTMGTQLDVTNDSVSTQPVEPSNINTSAAATSLVIKASAGTLYEVRGHNDAATSQYIQVHDAASLPADTAVPEDSFLVPADSNFSITFPQGKSCGTGIVVSNSSTLATKTIGSADCWFSAEFI